jgi:hypothetical protein
MASTAKYTVQVSDNRPVLHFQVGVNGNYRKSDLDKPSKYSLKGLKTAKSLAGTTTTYSIIPASAFKAKGAFRKKHGFSLTPVELVIEGYEDSISKTTETAKKSTK